MGRERRATAEQGGVVTGWGAELWTAADLVTPMASRVAATLRVMATRLMSPALRVSEKERLGEPAEPGKGVAEAVVRFVPGAQRWSSSCSGLSEIRTDLSFWVYIKDIWGCECRWVFGDESLLATDFRGVCPDTLAAQCDTPSLATWVPRRLASTRRALPDARLAEINEVAGSTGNDPELDATLLRLHTETACRRGGALALTPNDLDTEQCLARLHEKGETVRWQPVSPTLMRRLVALGEERGAAGAERLLRYRNGRPITARRYDHLWLRLGKYLPWVDTQQVSTLWLRHTTLTCGRTELRLRRRTRVRGAQRQE